MKLGIDVSTYFDEKAIGAKYFYNGKEVDPLKLFREHNNVSLMRIRLWNDPHDEEGHDYLAGTCDLNKVIDLCKLAKDYGYEILLDFHYSDFFADPGKQFCPKEWIGLSFDEVKDKLYNFTKKSLETLKNKGFDIPYCQIGNEITNGMVWPYGQLGEGDPRSGYDNLSALLSTGIKALKEVYPHSKAIIHLERSYDQKVYYEYFSNIIKYGVNFDIIGMSYYPYWHGSFDELFSNIQMLKKEFKKDVMVVELGYGFTYEDYIKTGSQAQLVFVSSDLDQFNRPLPYPITRDGQVAFIREFLKRAKENGVIGVCYWEPLWIPGENICWASEYALKYVHEESKSTRNEWANQCLFDYEGQSLPALEEFKIDK